MTRIGLNTAIRTEIWQKQVEPTLTFSEKTSKFGKELPGIAAQEVKGALKQAVFGGLLTGGVWGGMTLVGKVINATTQTGCFGATVASTGLSYAHSGLSYVPGYTPLVDGVSYVGSSVSSGVSYVGSSIVNGILSVTPDVVSDSVSYAGSGIANGILSVTPDAVSNGVSAVAKGQICDTQSSVREIFVDTVSKPISNAAGTFYDQTVFLAKNAPKIRLVSAGVNAVQPSNPSKITKYSVKLVVLTAVTALTAIAWDYYAGGNTPLTDHLWTAGISAASQMAQIEFLTGIQSFAQKKAASMQGADAQSPQINHKLEQLLATKKAQ